MVNRHDASLVLVGDELLKGERSDKHLAFLARALRSVGVRLGQCVVVGDRIDEMTQALRGACDHSDVVIVTGGLGPTPDDLTRHAVARLSGLELEWHQPSWDAIVKFFERYNRTPTDRNRQQVEFPAGATVIPNAYGTAPGFYLTVGDTLVVVLPGPPRELQPMANEFVLPLIAQRFGRPPVRVETFRTVGVGESQLFEQLGDRLSRFQAYVLSSLPSGTGVDLILTQARPDAPADQLDDEALHMNDMLRAEIGSKYYEHGERSLANVVHDELVAGGYTLAIAESLTGGRIADELIAFPGSSKYLLADVVAYSNECKVDLLEVDPDVIDRFGAVSEEACRAMATGARECVGRRGQHPPIRRDTDQSATFGLATTGIAGPDGGSDEKPVGLAFIGLCWHGGDEIKRVRYAGKRQDVRARCAQGALWLLHDRLSKD